MSENSSFLIEPLRNRKCILYYVSKARYLRDTASIVNSLAEDSSIRVVLLIDPSIEIKSVGPLLSSMVEIAICAHPDAKGGVGARFDGLIQKLPMKLGEWAVNTFPFVLLLALIEIPLLLKARSYANKIVGKYNPVAYLDIRDRDVGLSYALIREVRRRKQKTFLIPWGYVNTAWSFSTRRKSSRNIVSFPVSSLVQWLLYFTKSRQIKLNNDVAYSFFKPGKYLAAKLLGMCPSNPWVYGSDVDYCFVSSEGNRALLHENGVPLENIIVSGDQAHDLVYASRFNREFSKKYSSSKKIILISLPHLGEHGLMEWSDHWDEMEFLTKSLSVYSEKYQVLISLHPRAVSPRYEEIAGKYSLTIISEQLSDCIGRASFFLCGWSSVLTWSVTLGLPTLVLDYYGVSQAGYEHFNKYLDKCTSRDDFTRKLSLVLSKEVVTHEDRMLPIFDGKSTDRIVTHIKEIVNI